MQGLVQPALYAVQIAKFTLPHSYFSCQMVLGPAGGTFYSSGMWSLLQICAFVQS